MNIPQLCLKRDTGPEDVVSSSASGEEHHGGTGRTCDLPENVKKNVSVGINQEVAVGLFAMRRYVIWVR